MALYNISASSTANTLADFAWAINIDRIPLPAPKSNTVLPLNEEAFNNMASR